MIDWHRGSGTQLSSPLSLISSIIWYDSRHHKWDIHVHKALKIRTAYAIDLRFRRSSLKLSARVMEFFQLLLQSLIDVDSLCNTWFFFIATNRF